jgi:hypothetical protein
MPPPLLALVVEVGLLLRGGSMALEEEGSSEAERSLSAVADIAKAILLGGCLNDVCGCKGNEFIYTVVCWLTIRVDLEEGLS